MRAAILTRKSNAQEATGDEEKSVALQERECRQLIERNGWELIEVFTEDAVSGALMTPEGRPELFRLLAACERKDRPFDVVVVSHEDRIGRDTFRSSAVIVRIIEAGVRLVSVATGERKLDTPTDELMLAITGFSGSIERHNVSRRVRAKHFDTVRRGGWSGGTVPLGYEKVKTADRSELRVDASKAGLVRRIFTMAAQGYGTRRIAKTLNEDPETRSVRRWSGAGIRDTLTNRIYVGQIVFGVTRDVKKGGRIVRVKSPDAPMVVERPDLRIVGDALVARVRARSAATVHLRRPNGQLLGKPERAVLASKYLLSGMLTCGICGSRLVVQHLVASGVRKRAYLYYRCGSNLNRKACPNNASLPIERIHDAVATLFQQDVLVADRVERVLRDLVAEHQAHPEQIEAQRRAVTAELARTEGRLAKLADALEEGGQVRTVLDRIKTVEREQRDLQARLEHLDGLGKAAAAHSNGAYRAKLEALLADWRGCLTADPVVGRQVLRKLLVGPLTVTPRPEGGFAWTGTATFSRAMGGILGAGADDERWSLYVDRALVADDLDSEVKAALTRRIEASRLSDTPSSRSWR
jgi:site-specific DNA recombinase